MVRRLWNGGLFIAYDLKEIPYQIEVRPFRNPYFREIGLAVKNRTKLTLATEKFIEYLKEVAS